jgi:hypothetical protein
MPNDVKRPQLTTDNWQLAPFRQRFQLTTGNWQLATFRQLATFLLLLIAAFPLRAQIPDSALTDAEVEQLRESRLVPSESVLLFVKFLDQRSKAIDDLFAHPRKPGREQDTHDLIEQFTSIADELADNLDDYGPRHADLRKALPKLLQATERWSTSLKSPPDDEAYAVIRRIALESIRDLRESATQLNADQIAWFKIHPPTKEAPYQPGESPRKD